MDQPATRRQRNGGESVNVTRRDLLTGSLALTISGLLGTTIPGTSVKAQADAQQKILIIVQPPYADSIHRRLMGLNSGERTGVWELDTDEVLDPSELERRLQTLGASHLLGLLDSCNHCLLMESVRDLTGTVLEDGFHRGDTNRHSLLAVVRPKLIHV